MSPASPPRPITPSDYDEFRRLHRNSPKPRIKDSPYGTDPGGNPVPSKAVAERPDREAELWEMRAERDARDGAIQRLLAVAKSAWTPIVEREVLGAGRSFNWDRHEAKLQGLMAEALRLVVLPGYFGEEENENDG